jgi:hypothetical protein
MNLSDFNTMLDYIATHAPGHPDLERLRSKGMTFTNEILIEKIHGAMLDSLPAPVVQSKRQDSDDAIIRSYNSTLNKLFTMRARLSNTFHISSGNHEDILIADQIKDVQDEINKTLADKNYYLEKKELPPIDSDEIFDIPSDPFELMDKLKNVQTSLSHRKRELSAIDQKKNPAQYAGKQKTIERLTKHKMYLEQAKRDKNSQSAGV